MRKPRVNFSFMKMSIPNLIEFSRKINTKMTGNAIFLNPDVTMAQLTGLSATLESKFILAANGDKYLKSDMRKAKEALLVALRKLAMFVEYKAMGDETFLLSSGFEIWKQRDAAIRPDFVALQTDKEGCVMVKHKSIKGAKTWAWQYCTDPIVASAWVSVGGTSGATCTFTGLKTLTKYWFRAAYITKDGQSNWCAPVSRILV